MSSLPNWLRCKLGHSKLPAPASVTSRHEWKAAPAPSRSPGKIMISERHTLICDDLCILHVSASGLRVTMKVPWNSSGRQFTQALQLPSWRFAAVRQPSPSSLFQNVPGQLKKRGSSNFHVEIGATTALIIWRVGFWSFGELDSCKSLYCDPLRRCRRTRVRHTAAPPALRAVSLPKSLPGEKKLKGRKSRWNPLVRRVLFHHV